MIYLREFYLPNAETENDRFYNERRTCYNTFYPYFIFPKLQLDKIIFEPLTIFYGGKYHFKTLLKN